MNGFSLVELMLSLSLGLALSGVMLQGLMADGQNSGRFSRLLRERAAQRRTLELIKGDLAQATAISTTPELEHHACGLAGRTPVLHLGTTGGPITYSVGAAPSAIWRGQVLMRCGPAFGLDGAITSGSQALNRVVIDGLVVETPGLKGCEALLGASTDTVIDLSGPSVRGVVVCLQVSTGLTGLALEQSFVKANGRQRQHITQSLVTQAPRLPQI
jgi:hypothetical protein